MKDAAATGRSLPRRFALLGGAAFLVGLIVQGIVHERLAVAQMQQMAEENNEALAEALANALSPQLAARHPGDGILDGPALASFDGAVRETLRGTRVAKVKLYDETGLTLYSSDPAQIGEDKSGNEGFLTAVGGGTASQLTYRDQFDAFEGAIAERDLLASYIPVRQDRMAAVPYVFEIYTDVTTFRQQIRRALVWEIGIVAVTFLAVYLTALRIVTVGHRAQRQRQDEAVRLAAAVARAESASDAKSSFLMQMSHELRTPLNAVIGFAELIRDGHLGPVSPPTYAEYAQDIHHAGLHLLGIVNGVLDYVKLDAGGPEPEPKREPVDPAALLRETAQMLTVPAADGGLSLEVEAGPDLPALVTNAQYLRQILVNLAGNAVKFTPAGGRVSLAVHPAPDRGSIRFTVSDTGIGIAPEDLPVCLSLFGQADSSLARRYGGIGLGLPLSVRFAERLGGRVEIDSAPGRGTVVTVSLPCRPAEAMVSAA